MNDAREIAGERADWLIDAIATATQDKTFLRGEPECDEGLCACILANAEKAITTALIVAERRGMEQAAAVFNDDGVIEQASETFTAPPQWGKGEWSAAVDAIAILEIAIRALGDGPFDPWCYDMEKAPRGEWFIAREFDAPNSIYRCRIFEEDTQTGEVFYEVACGQPVVRTPEPDAWMPDLPTHPAGGRDDG